MAGRGEQTIADGLDQVFRGSEPPPDDGGGILPPDCPVIALGMGADGSYWLSTASGILRRVSGASLTPNKVAYELFEGDVAWLSERYVSRNKNREEWNNLAVASALVQACKAAGYFNPSNVRGSGLWWRGEDEWDADGRPGPMVLHCGDSVAEISWEERKGRLAPCFDWRRPGCRIGDFVYRGGDMPLPRPAAKPASRRDMLWLAALLNTWNHALGRQAVALNIGAIGCSFLPGILQHRPTFVYEGPTGCGKSTLFALFEGLHGGAAWRKEKSTAPLIRDMFEASKSARLVILNEFEAVGDEETKAAVVRFFRDTYTRGEGGWGRGGRDMVDAAPPHPLGMMGAITAPVMDVQDMNRQVPIRLHKLRSETPDRLVRCRLARARLLGPRLLRRLLEQLPRFAAVYEIFDRALRRAGHRPRDINTWGTVLTMYELLAHDSVDSARVMDWVSRVAPSGGAGESEGSEARKVLDRILFARVGEWNGGDRRTVAEVLLESIPLEDPFDNLLTVRRMGITLTDAGGVQYLAISKGHPELDQMFERTPWSGGKWKKLLLQLHSPEAVEWPNPIRFARIEREGKAQVVRKLAILVPLDHLGISEEKPGTAARDGDFAL